MHRMSEFQTIHAPWHLDVRKQQRDVRPVFKYDDRLIRVDRADRRKSCVFDEIQGASVQHRIVFDDQYVTNAKCGESGV